MPKQHSFLVRDVPATGTRLQCGVTSAARCPTVSRRNHTVGGRTGSGANTQARPGGTSGWARRRDVTAPGRARRTHAHCAQHEGRGSDQVTRRWCYLPPPLPASSPLLLMSGKCCCRWQRKEGVCAGAASLGLGGSRPKEEAESWGYCLVSLVPSSWVCAPPLALKLGFTLDSPGELQKLLVSGSSSQVLL